MEEKTRKRSRPSEAAEEDNEDLISTLSDHIILHVLSFLDFRDVVKTSALSKRWSSVWTQVSAISFDFPFGFSVFNALREDGISSIDRFLLQCTASVIHKFHLCFFEIPYARHERVDLWIRFAVGRSVKDLWIYANRIRALYSLPRVLLQCESLTNLRLHSCRFPPFINGNLGKIRWSSLKVLSVSGSYMSDKAINNVLEGSPQLESLELESCYGMDNIRISSRKLRELVIRGYHVPRNLLRDVVDESSCLEVFAPYLRTLRLRGWWLGKEVIVLKEASSLVEAELNFCFDYIGTIPAILLDTVKGNLSELHFVDKFIVGKDALEVLHYYKGNRDFSLQLKCQHLTIETWANDDSFGRIAGVLERAQNVETLVIHFAPSLCRRGETSPCCNIKSLKTGHIRNIEIKGFSFSYGSCSARPNYCLSLIEALLRDGLLLEKMIIDVKWCWEEYSHCQANESHMQYVLEVAETILGYPRGSNCAKVILNYPFKRKECSVGLK